MNSLPADLRPGQGEQFTALICPNCSGAIVVRVEPRTGELIFRCRVGHLYSAEDVVVGKEEHVETTAWATVHAYEELAAFLRDAGNLIPSLSAAERDQRVALLDHNAAILRGLIENDRVIKLSIPADAPPDHGQ
jgi:hypothetical protein